MLDGGIYNDSAASIDECELAMMPQNDFLSLLYSEHEISARFIKMLANNINENEKKLLSLAYNSVRARTANVLLDLQKKLKKGRMTYAEPPAKIWLWNGLVLQPNHLSVPYPILKQIRLLILMEKI